MKEKIEKTLDFVSDYHKNDNSGHDFAHVKRVYANALQILEKEDGVDEFVLKMSVLLHDVDDYKLGGDGCQVKTFLSSLKIKEKTMNDILQTIDAIGFSKSGSNSKFATKEMKILSDADRLDAMGAIGICRCIMYGASKNHILFDENIFPIKDITSEQYKTERKENNSINHFFDKLLKLKDTMQTRTGAEIAKDRHEFMIVFLKQFFMEQGLDDWNKYLDNYLKEGKNNEVFCRVRDRFR